MRFVHAVLKDLNAKLRKAVIHQADAVKVAPKVIHMGSHFLLVLLCIIFQREPNITSNLRSPKGGELVIRFTNKKYYRGVVQDGL